MKVIIKKSDCKTAAKPLAMPAGKKTPAHTGSAAGQFIPEVTDTVKKTTASSGFTCDDTQCYVH